MQLNLFLLLALVISLSACTFHSGLTLEKRRYRNGFHFDFIAENNGEKVKTETPEKKLPELMQEPSDIPLELLHQNPFSDTAPSLALLENNVSMKSRSSGKRKMEIHFRRNVPLLKENGSFSRAQRYCPSFKFPNRKSLANTPREGGNIVWTLVGILVLIWLLSMLTGGWGLGGLIYILLLAAVILAILKLLEVM